MRVRAVSLLVGAVAVMLATAGCNGTQPASTSVDRLAEARAALPAEVRSSGELTIGTDPVFEPITFMKDSQYAGLDIDLGNAVAAKLGLRVKWATVSFGDLLGKIQGRNIDVAMSSMTDKADRQKQVDFVDYLNVGTSIVVKKGVGDIGGMPGLCGRRIAVQPGTFYVDMVQNQAKQCEAKKVTILQSRTPSADVAAGKADASMDDFPIMVADVQRLPGLELSGSQIEALPYGMAVAKDRPALTGALQAALYAIFEDGTYDQLLAKWKVKEGALKTGAINGGI
ncbi:ABC transporter substrate-binding protein [Krasilnikovia sp. MM14-A1259]|uniref:ABC transporter substrate-binding protein n=1 Tax=Krasilnikovia sp. MM14-A1259 TaxID=3373539 RepID=UPI0038289623